MHPVFLKLLIYWTFCRFGHIVVLPMRGTVSRMVITEPEIIRILSTSLNLFINKENFRRYYTCNFYFADQTLRNGLSFRLSPFSFCVSPLYRFEVICCRVSSSGQHRNCQQGRNYFFGRGNCDLWISFVLP